MNATKKFAFTLWYRYSLYERMRDLERKRDKIIIEERQHSSEDYKK
jgi:hypothetical protein